MYTYFCYAQFLLNKQGEFYHLLMKQCVIWLIFLQLCGSEYVDYSDYHPKNVPLQNTPMLKFENPSSEYKTVMRNLCDNWKSPISYLKKRGYMSPGGIDESSSNFKNQNNRKDAELKDNYFFFRQNADSNLRDNPLALDDDERSDAGVAVTEPIATESFNDAHKNETTGIINKVKDKFLSIFTHSGNDEDWTYDLDDSKYQENSNDYDANDRKLFVRSAPEKSTTFNENLFSNLSDTDIQYVKGFINCFKQSKKDFQVQLVATNETRTTDKIGTDFKAAGAVKPVESRPSLLPVQSTTVREGGIPSTTPRLAVSSTTSECFTVDSAVKAASTTNKPEAISTTAEAASSKTSHAGAKGTEDNLTVDLDINQKNGTGEETHLSKGCSCVPIVSTTSPLPLCPDKSKYITKSKFLAHLHHMVDEVGKPPHKPLDLTKIQDVIDKSKNLPTVIVGDGKTTECAPLRLNDMSFDLEWNRIEKSPDKGRDKLSTLDFPYDNQPQGQSLAAKFLQDVNSYSKNNEKYLNTPYGDNFLDSQQSLPDGLEVPLKISTKREAVIPSSNSHSSKLSKLLSDIASFPDPDEDYDDYTDSDSRRRIKGKSKSRGRKKPKPKAKLKGGSSINVPFDSANVDLVLKDSDEVDLERGNDFNSFDELKDIQFRVNNDDEEAISKFITNLNSPPEVFSFDVDKYLRSAQLEMEPQAPEFEIQSQEPRTFYEFMETPAIEKERLPLIDAPSGLEDEPVIQKRARPSGGKRDLLRQYIKGVSSALKDNFPELGVECNRVDEQKSQRSPNLDTDIAFRTNNLVDGFSTSLDAMNYIKSKDRDDFVDNFYLLNDGSSQIYDMAKQNPDITLSDRYSPQSLDIDLALDKKFRDLGIGAYKEAGESVDTKSKDEVVEGNSRIEVNDQFL